MHTRVLSVTQAASHSIRGLLYCVALLLISGALNAGIVAHFRFDESAGLTATNSAGPNFGTLSPSGASFASGGIAGNALQLDRTLNGHVLVGDTFGFATGDYSIVAWVKTQPADATPDSIVLGKHQAGFPNGYYLFLNQNFPMGQVGKASFFSPPDSVTSLTDVNDGQWHQVVLVSREGQTRTLFVDGTPIEAIGPNATMVAGSAPFIIGGIQGFGSPLGLFTGWIDEVQLYDHALSDRNVDFLFRHPGRQIHAPHVPQNQQILLAHWSFDEEGGDTARDGAGGYEGTLSATGASFTSGGIRRGALQLDRTQNGFVEVGSIYDFQQIDFTVVVWVKTAPGDFTPDTVVIGRHEAGFPNGYFLALNSIAGGFAGAPGKASFFPGDLGATVTSTSSVNDGNWHQVAVISRVGNSREIFVDGAPLEASAPYSAAVANMASFIIGGFTLNGQPTGGFTGLIDELQIYRAALTPANIDFLYAHPAQRIHAQPPDRDPTIRLDLLSYWKFDQTGATTAVDSAGDNDGALSSAGAAIVTGGLVGSALQLDRSLNGFVNFGDIFPLGSGDLSVSFWLKTPVGYSLEDSVVFGKHEAGFENGYFAFVNSSGGGGIGETGKISFYSGGFSITPTSTTTVTDGNWHHVLIVYRAGLSKTIYVDGAPAEDVEPSFPNNGNAAPFLIGGVNLFGQPLGLFTGFVDEVQIYSQALGDASANYLFEHPGAILHKDLPN